MKMCLRFLWGLPLALISNFDALMLKNPNTVSNTFVCSIFDISNYLEKHEARLSIKLLIISLLFVMTCFDEIEKTQTIYEITRVSNIKRYEIKKVLTLIIYTVLFWMLFSAGTLFLSVVSSEKSLSITEIDTLVKVSAGLIFCETAIALMVNLLSAAIRFKGKAIIASVSVIALFLISVKLTSSLSNNLIIMALYPTTAMTIMFLSFAECLITAGGWLIEVSVLSLAIAYIIDGRFNDNKNSYRKYKQII